MLIIPENIYVCRAFEQVLLPGYNEEQYLME